MRYDTSRYVLTLVAVLCTATLVAHSTDPPDSAVNPVTGYIETTDAAIRGGSYDVRHVTDLGPGQPLETTYLSSDANDEVDSRILISPSGDTWVVWWRDGATDEVVFRKRAQSTGQWGPEKIASDESESASRPEVVLDGSDVWAAYEYQDAASASIGVVRIDDDPDPWSRVTLGSTAYSGNRDVLAHAASGHLWVTWIDSGTDVGWSEYDAASETWGAAQCESYAADSPTDARARIKATVLGN